MPELDHSSAQWLILALCAAFVGFSKSGFPGLGILCIPLMAISFPAKISTGLILPLLAVGDLFAIAYYRRDAKWNLVLKPLPWALLGLVCGSWVVRHVDDLKMEPIIGVIILIMLGLGYWRSKSSNGMNVPAHWSFAASMGFAAGLTTQMANAAGPVMAIYLLAMKLPKNEFIGTTAWYFLILNWIKIGLFILEGRITRMVVMSDLIMIPLIAAGAFVGFKLAKKVPQGLFNKIVQILAAAAALKLASKFFF